MSAEIARTEHRGSDGAPILTYVAGSDGARRAAYAVEGVGEFETAGPAVIDLICKDMAGWVVSGPPELGRALAARGALVRRSFHTLSRSLVNDPPPESWAETDLGPGRRAVPCDRDPWDVFPAWRAAYSTPGHPDRHPGSDEEAFAERLEPLLAGRDSPLMEPGRLAVDADDRVVAGVVLTDTPGVGPWIADVFRRPGPEYAGLGTALLRRVVAAAASAGIPELGLSVSDANPARAVYERLGFVVTSSLVTVNVP